MRDETRLIAARAMKSAARRIISADIATLRRSLADRGISRRIRDRAVDGMAQAVQSGAALANENRVVTGLTVAVLAGWLARARLGKLAQWLIDRARVVAAN